MISTTRPYPELGSYANNEFLLRGSGERSSRQPRTMMPRISSDDFLFPHNIFRDLYFFVKNTSTASTVQIKVNAGVVIAPEMEFPDNNGGFVNFKAGKKFAVAETTKTGIVHNDRLWLQINWAVQAKTYYGEFAGADGQAVLVLNDDAPSTDIITVKVGGASQYSVRSLAAAFHYDSAEYVISQGDKEDTIDTTFVEIAKFEVRTNANSDKFLKVKQYHIGALPIYPTMFTYGEGTLD